MTRYAPIAAVDGPGLKALDRMIRILRIRQVGKHLAQRSVLLDVGCYDGALFSAYASTIERGVGIDPLLATSGARGPFRFIADRFPSDALGTEDGTVDAITFLAVLEHVPTQELPRWRIACEQLLKPGGTVLATVPSPRVDDILHVLRRTGLVEGMSVHEHHGLDAALIPSVFSQGSLMLTTRRRFELGLNNLYVFRKRAA